jgi:hypothetical protein
VVTRDTAFLPAVFAACIAGAAEYNADYECDSTASNTLVQMHTAYTFAYQV